MSLNPKFCRFCSGMLPIEHSKTKLSSIVSDFDGKIAFEKAKF